MKKLSLLLDSGNNEVYLEMLVQTGTDCKMEVRNAAVYCNFRKITKNFNDTVTLTSTPKDDTFGEGYWTFHVMAERLTDSDVKLDRNRTTTRVKFFRRTAT